MLPFRTYQNVEQFIMQQLPMFQRIGAPAYKANLDNTIALLDALGNPHKQFVSIHIGGTNGKGSVSHMLASILQEAGYKTGLFTSPHLKDYRERIKINGQLIEKSYIKKFINAHLDIIAQLKPSFFELSVALAYDYFFQKRVDVAVIEVGMGGRLDSTNLITPLLSIITHVDYDHMQFLGDTLEKIAIEKAGIIKSKVPVLLGRKQEEIAHVFEQKSKDLSASLFYAKDIVQEIQFRSLNPLASFVDVFAKTLQTNYFIQSPLIGWYQEENIATVIAASELLSQKAGVNIQKKHVENGIRKVLDNTGFKGRWYVKRLKVPVIFDIGHNEEGIREVSKMLGYFMQRPLHIVLGMVEDKDHKNVLKYLPKDARYYFCRPSVPRGFDANELAKLAHEAGLKGKTYSSVKKALSAALRSAKSNAIIFVGGSTFTVAEAI